MAGYGHPNGRGRLGFRAGDGWSNAAYRNGAEVNQNDVKAMPGALDCPDRRKDGAITDGVPSKGGSYQGGRLYARDDKPRARESINGVQSAGSDGAGRAGFPAGIFGRQKFDHGGYEVGADETNTNGWNPPAHGRHEYPPDNVSTEPTSITTAGWTRPGRPGWAMMSPEVPLGKATNNIGTAAGYPARPSSAPWNSALPNAYQPGKKKDSATTTIDSREAAKKYGKATNDIGTAAGYPARPSSAPWNSALPNAYQPGKKKDSATTTIDSREAAKKYGGMLV